MTLSFQARIVLFFSMLLITVQGLTVAAVSWVSKANVTEQLNQILLSDAHIFDRLLMERSERVASEARLLAADFGFKSVVAAPDPATQRSALENLVYRIHGHLGFFVGLDGRITAATRSSEEGRAFFFPEALLHAEEQGKSVFFGHYDNKLYEWAVVPVLAPVPVGSIAIALTADQHLLEQLLRLAPTHLDISLIEQNPQGVRIMASSLTEPLRERLSAQLSLHGIRDDRHKQQLHFGDTQFVTQVQRLPSATSDSSLFALLQVDLAEALQPYTVLYYTVAGLLLIGLVGSLIGGYFIARRVAHPVRMLVDANTRMLAGEFAEPLQLQHDVELRRLAETFNRAGQLAAELNELKQQDQQRRELVANVSHDIRSPLTTLHAYLETLRKTDNLRSPEHQHYLDVAVSQSEKVGRLAQALFDLAKLECAAQSLHREPFGMSDLIQDITQKFSLRANQAGVMLTSYLPPGLPWVNADISLVERVMTNLIDNALKHTPKGGAVKVALERHQDNLRIIVIDSGAGIAAEHLPTLFDRDSTLRRISGSTSGGLGLIIVGKILALHGSSIQVESVPQQGSRFWFDLPMAQSTSLQRGF